jgi:hypothetical protein
MNGSWSLMPVFQAPMLGWWHNKVKIVKWDKFKQVMPDALVLHGVPFGLVALLAIDEDCEYCFNRITRVWSLNFLTAKECGDALEVIFPRAEHWSEQGIQMEYSHGEPGKVTVTLRNKIVGTS